MKPAVHWVTRLAYPLEGDWVAFEAQMLRQVPRYQGLATGSDFVDRDVVFDYDTRAMAREALRVAKEMAKMAGRKLLVARVEPCRNPDCGKENA